MKLIEKEVLGRITPPPLSDEVKRVILKVQEALPRTDVMLGGSTAKGTHLAGDYDVDVFVRFDHNDNISDELEEGLQAIFPDVERVHGSRDYFQVQQQEWTYEFVPVLKITNAEEAENVTDVSPLHVGYVQKQLAERSNLVDDIRLLKQFCKSAGVYGAETYIGGFSGHVLELLILDFGGFEHVMNASIDWKDNVTLDPAGLLDDPKSDLDESKTRSPLILVDPVQPNRNAAAAVTIESFIAFKERAMAYLRAEDSKEEFFTITPLTVEAFREKHPRDQIVVIHLAPQDGKKDIVAAKCAKVVQFLSRALHDNHFTIKATAWEFTESLALVLFALPQGKLDAEEIVRGPPTDRTSDVVRFEEKYDDVYEEDKRVWARKQRAYREPTELLLHILKDDYITHRVRDARVKQ